MTARLECILTTHSVMDEEESGGIIFGLYRAGEKSLALVTAALKRRHWIRVLEKFKQYVQEIR